VTFKYGFVILFQKLAGLASGTIRIYWWVGVC